MLYQMCIRDRNKTSIQVGAGQVSASLTGYESEYNYKVDVGLGSVLSLIHIYMLLNSLT